MNPYVAFVLGLLVGWLVEWIVDWLYWRRKNAELDRKLNLAESKIPSDVDIKMRQTFKSDLENQLNALKAENAALREQVTNFESEKTSWQAQKSVKLADETVVPAAPPVIPDNLVLINGIGPVIAKKLNDAGIYTFEDLADLTPTGLRSIVGDVIQRLANEEDLLAQAKKFAAEKERAAHS